MPNVVSVQMNVPVLRQVGGGYDFSISVYVTPSGGAQRLAQAGEVQVRLQYQVAGIAWWDEPGSPVNTDGNGNVDILLAQNLVNPSTVYQITALHFASGALVTMAWMVRADGSWTLGQQVVQNTGNSMPATFQENKWIGPSYVAPQRSMAIGEVRNTPFQTGYVIMHKGSSAAASRAPARSAPAPHPIDRITGRQPVRMHQEHGRGLAFPEVRQATRSGPNPSLPGRRILVRETIGDGPGTRSVAI
jgi:hypothetical protein